MPPRRRRPDQPARLWPLAVLFALGVLGGVLLWGYAPTLPAEQLVKRYAKERSMFLDIGGARAHVRDEGNPEAIPILLIHGSLASLQVWEGWVGELKGRARLVSVDLPGHGLTGAWPRDEYTIEAYTDFIEVLVDILHLDRFVLVGHSLGGAVAWSFAATRPDRVSHLILIDSAGYPRSGELPIITQLTRLPVIGDLGIWFKPEAMVRRSLRQIYADPAMVTSERVQRYGELQRFPGNRRATLLRARTQEMLDPTTLKRLKVPTLVLWGARDRWVPTADAARFQNDIKGAKLAIFEKLGHNPMEEDPRATAAAVDAFLPATLPPLPPPPAAPAEPASDQVPMQEQTVTPAFEPEKD